MKKLFGVIFLLVVAFAFWLTGVLGAQFWFCYWIFFLALAFDLLSGGEFFFSLRRPGKPWIFTLKVYLLMALLFFILDAYWVLIFFQYWRYPYYSTLVHWSALYLVSYPFLGFFFLSFTKIFLPKLREVCFNSLEKVAMWLVFGLFALLVPVMLLIDIDRVVKTYVFGLHLAIFVFVMTIYLRHTGIKPFAKLWLWSIAWGIVMEIPGVTSQEWVYQNLPIGWEIFGISLFVVAFWIVLSAVPLLIAAATLEEV